MPISWPEAQDFLMAAPNVEIGHAIRVINDCWQIYGRNLYEINIFHNDLSRCFRVRSEKTRITISRCHKYPLTQLRMTVAMTTSTETLTRRKHDNICMKAHSGSNISLMLKAVDVLASRPCNDSCSVE